MKKLLYSILVMCLSFSALHAQITLTKIQSSPTGNNPIPTGQAFQYELKATLSSPTLTNIVLTDVIPPELKIISVSHSSSWQATVNSWHPTNNPSTNTIELQYNQNNYQTGLVTSITINVKFKEGETCDGTTVCNSANIQAMENGLLVEDTVDGVCITASSTDRWQLSKTHDAGSALDNPIIYDVLITNPANALVGSMNMNAAELTDDYPANANVLAVIGPAGQTLLPNVDYFDTPSNHSLRIPVGNLNVNDWTRWTKYQVILEYPSTDFSIGDLVTNCIVLDYEDACGAPKQLSSCADVTLQAPFIDGSLGKFVYEGNNFFDDYVPGCVGRYEIRFENDGNVPLTTFDLFDNLPADMPIFIDMMEVFYPNTNTSIDVTSSNGGAYVPIGAPNSSSIPGLLDRYDSNNFPNNGTHQLMTSLRFRFGQVNPGELIRIRIEFTILNTDIQGNVVDVNYPTISNCMSATLPNNTPLFSYANFNIENHAPDLEASKFFVNSSGKNSYNLPTSLPGDKVRYRIRIQNHGSQAANALVISDILESRLQYCGGETYYFGNSSNPNTSSFSNSVPTTVGNMTVNHNGANLEWQFQQMPGSCLQSRFFYIEFDAQILPDAFTVNGNHIPNNFSLSSANFNSITSNTLYFGLTPVIEVYPNKKVRKAGTLGFQVNMISQAGSTIEYALCITNTGTIPLEDLVLVDMLPFSGDTYILSPNSARGSQFPIYLTAPIQSPTGFGGTIEYSDETDPNFVNTLGINAPGTTSPVWTSSPSYPMQQVRNIRITFPSNFVLVPAATETFIFNAVVPVGVNANLKACNNFAYKAFTAHNNNIIGPNESDISCVTIDENPSCCMGDFVWCDLDNNGVQNVGEPGKNNITIHLLDANSGNILQTTITANNALGAPGYYQFCNLEDSDYQIEIDLPAGQFITGKDVGGDDDLDSDIDPYTHQSPPFTIDTNLDCIFDDLDIGLTDMEPVATNPCGGENCISNCFIAGTNLVPNADFEQGNTGFSSDLPLAIPSPCDDESYLIGHEPRDQCVNFPTGQFDHTFGNIGGHFMIIDGHRTEPKNVWFTNVTVIGGKRYQFSFWALDFLNGNNPAFELIVDGNVIGSVLPSELSTGNWTRHCASWVAPANGGTVTIAIRQSNFGFSGLDYGLDDVCFAEMIPRLEVEIAENFTVCSGVPLDLNPIITGTVGSTACVWTSNPNVWSANTCNATFSTNIPGTYVLSLVVNDESGCSRGINVIVEVLDCNFSCSCNEMCAMPGPNLVSNGHFEFPSQTGFGTDLTPGATNTCTAGTYRVDFEPAQLCNAFPFNVFDHTVGTNVGNFLIIDGDRFVPQDVWFSTSSITVNVNTTYNLSFFTMNFAGGQQADLEIQVNGTSIGTTALTGNPSSQWTEHCFKWKSGNYSGPVTLTIRQTNFDFIAYDYGIDDICFSEQLGAIQVSLPDDPTICELSSFNLNTVIANGASANCTWLPINYLDNASSCNPVFTAPAGPGVYTYTVTVFDENDCSDTEQITITVLDCELSCPCDDECTTAGQNLVLNGNFEQGDVLFNTANNFNAVAPGSCARGYLIDQQPRDLCINFPLNMPDHTLGNGYGHYMLIDGVHPAPIDIYRNTVPVTTATDYNISFWSIRFNSGASPAFDVLVNSQVVGTTTPNETVNGQWMEHCFNWNSSDLNGPVIITLRQTNSSLGTSGYDYGIDDICFSEVQPVLTAGIPDDFTMCNYGNELLAVQIPIGASCSFSPTPYLSNFGNCTATFTPPGPGVYTYTITVTKDGCTYEDEVVITVENCIKDCTCGLEGCEGAGHNLVQNGHFEGGFSNVFSDLSVNGNCAGSSYWIDHDARDKCTNGLWNTVYPPTGGGNFMIIDGSNARVWYQNITINNGQEYAFSFDFYPDISGDPSPTLELRIGNTVIASGITGSPGMWNNICELWTADIPTPTANMTLSIRQTATNGYADYGIDNICFHEINPLSVSIEDMTYCLGQSYILTPTITGGSGTYTCSWSPTPGLINPTSCNPGFSPTSAGTYNYTLTVMDDNMCETSIQVMLIVENCGCSCDREFRRTVAQGYGTYATVCRTRNFIAPQGLDPSCDMVEWSVRPIGQLGHNTFGTGFNASYNFASDGKYEVCMKVTRTTPTGTCVVKNCRRFRVRCIPPYVSADDSVILNGGFTDDAHDGVLGIGGTLSNWNTQSGSPLVNVGEGCDDENYVTLGGNRDVGDVLEQVIVLPEEKHYELSFCYQYPENSGTSPLPGTALMVTSIVDDVEHTIYVGGEVHENSWPSSIATPIFISGDGEPSICTLRFRVLNDIPDGGNEAFFSYLDIDNIKLIPVNDDCDDLNLEITDSEDAILVGTMKYQAFNTLTSDAIIGDGSYFTFKAGQEVSLNPGFEVELGAVLEVIMEACDDQVLPLAESSDDTENFQTIELTDKQNIQVPKQPQLSCFPNPARDEATIQLLVPEMLNITGLHLMDLNGRLLSDLTTQKVMESGIYQIPLNTNLLQDGIYLISLQTEKERITQRLVVIK